MVPISRSRKFHRDRYRASSKSWDKHGHKIFVHFRVQKGHTFHQGQPCPSWIAVTLTGFFNSGRCTVIQVVRLAPLRRPDPLGSVKPLKPDSQERSNTGPRRFRSGQFGAFAAQTFRRRERQGTIVGRIPQSPSSNGSSLIRFRFGFNTIRREPTTKAWLNGPTTNGNIRENPDQLPGR